MVTQAPAKLSIELLTMLSPCLSPYVPQSSATKPNRAGGWGDDDEHVVMINKLLWQLCNYSELSHLLQ